ncbi:MAG: DUF116 domain-containing protein [Bacteroidia bacterium]|nr:DUF116 domain-containing protein [Bacteroidia bacterium]
MKPSHPGYLPVTGKTYTLFGDGDSTSGYYETIRKLADEVTNNNPLTEELIEEIRVFSRGKRNLRKCLKKNDPGDRMPAILNLIDPHLREYTEKVDEHLKKLPLRKFWDFRLATTREQYHLYMLEIELTNRLYVDKFLKADRKIALLPYCLQDFSVTCKADKNGFDYQCKHCSEICYQNHASLILEEHSIEPYIWMGGDMKQLAKYSFHENRTFGILGIACIPELINGMRTCRKNHIPVIGFPLNGNCCIRWHGEFFPNSIDLEELERLLQ